MTENLSSGELAAKLIVLRDRLRGLERLTHVQHVRTELALIADGLLRRQAETDARRQRKTS